MNVSQFWPSCAVKQLGQPLPKKQWIAPPAEMASDDDDDDLLADVLQLVGQKQPAQPTEKAPKRKGTKAGEPPPQAAKRSAASASATAAAERARSASENAAKAARWLSGEAVDEDEDDLLDSVLELATRGSPPRTPSEQRRPTPAELVTDSDDEDLLAGVRPLLCVG